MRVVIGQARDIDLTIFWLTMLRILSLNIVICQAGSRHTIRTIIVTYYFHVYAQG